MTKSTATPTPRPWYILAPPTQEQHYFLAGPVTEDHPAFNHTRHMDIIGDEDYPRKRADMELIVKAVNAFEPMVEALKYTREQIPLPKSVIEKIEAALKLAGEGEVTK